MSPPVIPLAPFANDSRPSDERPYAWMSDPAAIVLDRYWSIIMKDLGLVAADVLRRARLPDDLLSQPNRRVTLEEYFRLWNALEAAADDPLLPLRLGDMTSAEAFHPALFAALCSPNLAVAIRRIADYKRLIAPMRVLVEDRAEGLAVSMEWLDPRATVPPSLAATELVFLTRIARIGARERICPVAVASPYPIEPAADYEAFFGARLLRRDRHGVTFRHEDAQLPFLTASDALWQTFEPDLRRRLSELDASATLPQKIRSVLLENLPSGEMSIEVVAGRLGLTPRTLQRRLRRENVSYTEIVRKTREDLARHYLANTELAYAEISFLIGFEEPTSFFRAFREWTGETPDTARKAAVH